MKILILSHFSGSAKHGMVFRNYAMAEYWVSQGHETTIVACGYSHFRQCQPVFAGRIGQETIHGIKYVWVRSPRYSASSNLGRVVSMLSFTAQCMWLPLPLESNYDVIICSSPHPFAIYPARKLAQRFNARLIYDIRDLWPMTLKYLGNLSSRHPFIYWMQKAEDYGCKHADLITAVPQNAQLYLQSRGLPKERFLAVANGASPDTTPSKTLPSLHRDKLKTVRSRARYIIGYAGTLGIANAMNEIIDAMQTVPEDIHLAIVGDGNEKEKLVTQAQLLKIDHRVHFLPSVPRNQVKAFLSCVDIGYAATTKSPLYQYGASLTKVNDYLLAGLPILYAVGDPGNPIELSGAGISCSPGDPSALSKAITSLISYSKDELLELGKAGQAWCLQNQLTAVQAEKVLVTLNSLPPRKV